MARDSRCCEHASSGYLTIHSAFLTGRRRKQAHGLCLLLSRSITFLVQWYSFSRDNLTLRIKSGGVHRWAESFSLQHSGCCITSRPYPTYSALAPPTPCA